MITGAQIMVKCLEQEGVSVGLAIRARPSAPFYDALYATHLSAPHPGAEE